MIRKLTALCILLFSLLSARAQHKTPVDYADPMVGTSESRWILNPGATMPFGMVQLSPDNQSTDWKAGYEYTIGSISGFSHIHAGTMAGLSVMPTTGMVNPAIYPPDAPSTTGRTAGHRSRINKSTEQARPGYYAADLINYGIKAELTSTTRGGFFKFTFPETHEAHVLFNLLFPAEYPFNVLDARITKVSDTEIEGYSRQQSGNFMRAGGFNDYTVHFVARFNKPFKLFGGWKGHDISTNITQVEGSGDIGAYVDFDTKAGEVVLLQTGISYVSIAQARLNMQQEMDPFQWNFAAARQHATDTWNTLLSKIKVEGGTEENKKKLYTNLYRSYCARSILSDVDGKYMDVCEQERQLQDPASPVFGCDAFWNTFWNLNQLWTLVNPDIANQWARSLLEMYKTGGWLPRGPAGFEYSGIMEASHEIALIVSAYQKGICRFDTALAWQAMLHQQTVNGEKHPCSGFAGNKDIQTYMQLGYIPQPGRVSNTLEYAYDDWCVAQMAKSLGDTGSYHQFIWRAANYQHMFDPQTRYMRPKDKEGHWLENFNPITTGGYTEGNAWQYSFFVPHDVNKLVDLMGRDTFNNRLTFGFEQSAKLNFNAIGDKPERVYINHGNQPNMQAAYLFNYSGKPWLTQYWVREIMNKFYGADPYNGWPGDEDEGQMGAWFVMSAMGLFETDGGTAAKPIYEIGSPLFDRVTIELDPRYYPGKTFVIEARQVSDGNRYIQSATLNGKKLDKPWFYHAELVRGGKLVLQMGPAPNKDWGSKAGDAPPSMSGAVE
ncbi:glycoside hydrolase family 92 protein [Chitinophaga agrisoli]|uniref:Glycoside hydrolase family 92 protein n=1 Tax=Chitinophaga agrisoli TaxID=2607653 RepID=A0A5B2VVF2_9BACT|nr:GH92 family glycosyl hydrolase [Chitinophaga agrisoli]KAA2242650.1 glycoside hydrolase family 92 protein [Chitinophaga agrisoli]